MRMRKEHAHTHTLTVRVEIVDRKTHTFDRDNVATS